MHATGSLLALILDVQYSTAACRSASPLGDELNQADYERDQAALVSHAPEVGISVFSPTPR